MFARVQWVLTSALVALATGASAQSASVTAQGSLVIADPVSLTVNQVLTVVAIQPPAVVSPPPIAPTPPPAAATAAPTANVGSTVTTTETLPISPITGAAPSSYVVRDGGGQTLSVAVPQTLDLVQVGGGEQVTLSTTTGIITGSGLDLLGGPLGSGGALSFSVADRAIMFSDTELGAYTGLLVLTAQYN